MTFIKDESNNTLNIVIANYFGCSKKTTISLQNKSLFIKKIGEEKSGSQYKDIIMIIIYNTNLNEIDLDNTNIQSIPFKLMYKFSQCSGIYKDIHENIKQIISSEFENDIDKELIKYNNSFKNTSSVYLHNEFIKYYRYNDHFFKLSDNFYSYFAFKLSSNSKSKENFQRLDWIFSNNFDRIFIGVVKDDKTYLNKIIYNINLIDKFIIEKNNNIFYFRLLLNDGNNINICEFRKQETDNINNFILLINGQINDIKNRGNEKCESCAPTIKE